jgi:hypothetical protein
MKKIIYTLSALAILIGLAFFALYTNGTRNDKSEPVAVSTNTNENEAESVQTSIKKQSLSGSFTKIDPLHYASGKVNVLSDENYYYINLAEDFSSADGPDLYVYLSSEQNYKNIAVGGVDTSKTLNIGELKNISGAQSYKVSKQEFEKYSDSVIIWCKKFGVQFSRAELK